MGTAPRDVDGPGTDVEGVESGGCRFQVRKGVAVVHLQGIYNILEEVTRRWLGYTERKVEFCFPPARKSLL